MTLQNAIATLAKEHINQTNEWYNWVINQKELPNEIVLAQGGNAYSMNKELKNKLNEAWKNADDAKKRELTFYYIYHWGGIKKNGEATIDLYASATPEVLIARGTQGIASWSKALCVRDANNYAIFDARVSASLNSLQIIHNVEQKILFPVLPSRNNVIKRGNVLLKKSHWQRAGNANFYQQYLGYLHSTFSALEKNDISIATIEMLLFAKAEELLKQAFPQI
jgi:hypothetical protein